MSEFTDKLRAIATWFDEHPDLPEPSFMPGFDVFVSTRDEFAHIARQLGKADKGESGSVMYLRARIDGCDDARVDFNIARTEICERVVLGTKRVPKRVVEAHDEEIVEWRCHSILAESEVPS